MTDEETDAWDVWENLESLRLIRRLTRHRTKFRQNLEALLLEKHGHIRLRRALECLGRMAEGYGSTRLIVKPPEE